MVEIAVELLLVELGSTVVEVTVAVFDDVVDELKVAAFTLIVMITKAPTFMLSSVQLTVVVADVYVQLPCDDGIETEEYVTWPGRTSVTVTPVATAGPLFVTCSV
jgi:hypothetical protein